MARFRRGAAQAIKERSCEPCLNGRHKHCLTLLAEMGFGQQDWGDDPEGWRDAFTSINCNCYTSDVKREKHG